MIFPGKNEFIISLSMKKLLILILFIISNLTAKAEFLPAYTDSIKHPGIGVYLAPKTVTLYEERSEFSPVIDKFSYNNDDIIHSETNLSARKAFIAFVPKKKIALFTVEDEDDEWVRVYYDQYNGSLGWIKKDETERFFNWREFFYYYGKKNGLYVFRNLDKELYKLNSQPTDDAQTVDTFDYARFISLTLIKGNWLLVKVFDLDKTQKIGWFKFRNSEGGLYLFPYL